MKKQVFILLGICFSAFAANAAEVDLQQMDTDSRVMQPASNSIMFRRNAEQYQQLSDEERAELDRQRELNRQQMEEYERKKAEYERKQAMLEAQQRAMEEEARRRAEALKPITLYENKLKIYALVNGEIITSNDMQSRINAFILTTGIPYNQQTKEMITNKVLQAAIDEKLKLQEAKKNKIVVLRAELNKAVSEFEQVNGMQPGQLKQELEANKVSMNVWATQIEADLAWKKLIAQKGYANIRISENEIKRAMDDVQKDMKTQKIMLLEIVINKKDAKEIKQLAETLRQDPRFELYAMQFSQSPSAVNGGRLGWITKGKLPNVLEQKAFALKEGEVSDPISYGNDYYIYKLEKIFNPATDAQKLPSKQEVKSYLENKKLEELATKYMKDLRSKALIEKKV